MLYPAALNSLNNAGPHGLSEMLYAFSSAAANNGSAFAGLSAQHRLVQLRARGRDVRRPLRHHRPGPRHRGQHGAEKNRAAIERHIPDDRPDFHRSCSSAVILIVGALTFFPVLSLGPIVEHFLMQAGRTF